MTFAKRSAGILITLLGLIGVVAGGAGVWAVRTVQSTVLDLSDSAFTHADTAIEKAQTQLYKLNERTRANRDRLAETDQTIRKIMDEINLADKIVDRETILPYANRLESMLLRADENLELALGSLELYSPVFDIGHAIGMELDPKWMDEPKNRIEEFRVQIVELNERIEQFRSEPKNGTSNNEADNDPDRRKLRLIVDQLQKITAVAETFDHALEKLDSRLSETKNKVNAFEQTVQSWIRTGTLICYLLIVWIAAGQLALCGYGWRICAVRS